MALWPMRHRGLWAGALVLACALVTEPAWAQGRLRIPPDPRIQPHVTLVLSDTFLYDSDTNTVFDREVARRSLASNVDQHRLSGGVQVGYPIQFN